MHVMKIKVVFMSCRLLCEQVGQAEVVTKKNIKETSKYRQLASKCHKTHESILKTAETEI